MVNNALFRSGRTSKWDWAGKEGEQRDHEYTESITIYRGEGSDFSDEEIEYKDVKVGGTTF